MRKSRVLLAGVAVAAAAAATSAFTASNTLNDSVAGYDAAVVSGVTITSTTYVPDGTDIALIDSIDFVATGDIEDQTATLQFRDALGDPVGAAITCSIGTYASPSTPITCPTPDKPLASFVGIGLTVAD